MTKAEAEAIEDIGTVFSNVKGEKWTFEEFKYFRNVNLTSIKNEALKLPQKEN